MSRSAASFRRPESRLRPQPTVLVICEDTKSSRNYLQDAARHFRVHVKVEITHCGKNDPKNIVTEAIRSQVKFDRVYCVIDRDAHENFEEALELARESLKVTVIASYPCFEFWLMLHFGYTRKPYAAAGNGSAGDRLISDLRTCPGMDKYSKGNTRRLFDSLLGAPFNTARSVAPKVLQEAKGSGQMNPSTLMHELIDLFESLSTPQLK